MGNPLQNFVDKIGPTVSAAWLNGVDQTVNVGLNSLTTKAGIQAWLQVPSPGSLLPIDSGGTGAGDAPTALVNLGVPGAITSTVTATYIGQHIYPLTTAEGVAGVTPTNFTYAPGNVLRYGADPTGAVSSIPAFTAAYNVAIAGTPHGFVYAPTGTYLIPTPGLNWTSQLDIRFFGDGPDQTTLQGSTDSNYRILTINADTGGGTTGLGLNLANFAIKNGAGSQQAALKCADYIYSSFHNLLLQSSGTTLIFTGMANYTCTNLNVLTWNSNGAGNAALFLGKDTLGIPCGPGSFSGCQFEGAGAVTTAGAINSTGTFGTTFIGCSIISIGPAMQTAAEFANLDDVTLLDCYSESTCNTTATNFGSQFYLGRVAAPINFTMIGGHWFNGDGSGHFCQYGITGVALNAFTIIGTTWANFVTAALNLAVGGAGTQITAINNISQGAGSPPLFVTGIGAPSTGAVQLWMAPGLIPGYGIPTGNVNQGSFAAGSITLPNLAAGVAQLIIDLKKIGLLAN